MTQTLFLTGYTQKRSNLQFEKMVLIWKLSKKTFVNAIGHLNTDHIAINLKKQHDYLNMFEMEFKISHKILSNRA